MRSSLSIGVSADDRAPVVRPRVPSMSSGRVYAGRTAEERALERREALLDAGLELFGTRPFTGVSVSAVIQLAKVTRRGFYEQFKDRVDLLRAVDERTRDGIAHLLAPLG